MLRLKQTLTQAQWRSDASCHKSLFCRLFHKWTLKNKYATKRAFCFMCERQKPNDNCPLFSRATQEVNPPWSVLRITCNFLIRSQTNIIIGDFWGAYEYTRAALTLIFSSNLDLNKRQSGMGRYFIEFESFSRLLSVATNTSSSFEAGCRISTLVIVSSSEIFKCESPWMLGTGKAKYYMTIFKAQIRNRSGLLTLRIHKSMTSSGQHYCCVSIQSACQHVVICDSFARPWYQSIVLLMPLHHLCSPFMNFPFLNEIRYAIVSLVGASEFLTWK